MRPGLERCCIQSDTPFYKWALDFKGVRPMAGLHSYLTFYISRYQGMQGVAGKLSILKGLPTWGRKFPLL